jgi:anti-sigma B factor antagonist
MQININQFEEITVVSLTGDIDAKTAPIFQQNVLPLTDSANKIIMDMANIIYMSSAGLRMLLSLYRQVTAKKGKVVLVGLREEIRDIMSATGFLDFFTTSETVDSGLAALK